MPWDLACAHEAAARNGLAGIAIPAGEDLYSYSGDDLTVRGAGAVFLFTFRTAAIANYVQGRWHKKVDANWNRARGFVSDQTGATAHRIAYLNYPVASGDVLTSEADNGNNSQIENVAWGIAYGSMPMVREQPIIPIPPNAQWIEGDGGTAAVANTWTTSAVTWLADFNQNARYRIYGMMAQSATMYAARLIFKSGSTWTGYAPGGPGGDTAIINFPLYGDFGDFIGGAPPDIEVLCSGTDAAQYVHLLIAPV